MAAAAFLALEYPYATAAGIGTGVFAISYLAAKKATKAPNDNLWYLLTGGGYVNPVTQAINDKNSVSPWAHPITYLNGVMAEKGGGTGKPLYTKEGYPYYSINGKNYTPQELYLSLHAANGVPVRPNDWPTDLNVDDTRKNAGNFRPSANDPSLLVQDTIVAKQVPSFYPPTAENAKKANAALSLAEQEFVATHRELFQQVYGNKELSSSDVAQVYVAQAHASRADTRTDNSVKAWVKVEDWANLKSKEEQDRYGAIMTERAAKWAQQVGTSGTPQPTPTPAPKPTLAQVLATPNPFTPVSLGVGSFWSSFWSKIKGDTPTKTPAPVTPKPPAAVSKPVVAIPQKGPSPNWMDGPPAAAPARKPTRGRGW